MTGNRPLEPSDEEFRAMLSIAADYVAGVVERIPEGPAFNAGKRVFLSSTRPEGRYVGRINILNNRTDHAGVTEAVKAVRHHAAELSG